MKTFISSIIFFIISNTAFSQDWYVHESEGKYKTFLDDLEAHMPKSFNWKYRFSDKVTQGHELTHGITNYLQNKYGDNCYYIGNNHFAFIKSPNITITQIAGEIPKHLHRSRYFIYFVDQPRNQPILEKIPLYVIDEWNGYINGMQVGLEEYKNGYRPDRNNYAQAVKEFNDYCSYIIPAIDKFDKTYDKKNLQEFINWNLNRGEKIYKEAFKIELFNLETK